MWTLVCAGGRSGSPPQPGLKRQRLREPSNSRSREQTPDGPSMTDTTTPRGFLQAVPNILWQQRRWIRWLDKRPIAWGSDRWTSYHDQREWRAGDQIELPKVGGVGFSFSKPVEIDGYQTLAFDLDACRDKVTGAIEPWAKDFVIRCGKSYTEITPSGQGLRTWLLVKNLPEMHQSEWKPLAMTRAAGTTKQVECQVYGGSCTGYVTVTGDKLPGSRDDVVKVESLDWWSEVFGQPIDAGVGHNVDEAGAWNGEGFGDEPTLEEVKAAVRSTPAGVALMDCAWKGNPALNGLADKSNSEAFAALEVLAVKAARWHREAAVKFLLRECPRWSDPGMRECYSREDWVRKDLARVAPSKPVFEPLPDEPAVKVGEAPAEKIEKKARYRIRLFEEVATDPPVQWLVDELLPRGGLVVLAGGPGAAKSLLILDAAARMARGLTWLGKAVKAASTLYLVGEGGGGMGARIRAWMAKHGGQEKVGGEYVALLDGIPNLAVDTAVLTLLEIMEQCEADYGKMPEVVVVDTLAMAAPGAEENETKDMGLLLKVLAEVRLRTGCTFVVLHHLKKLPPGTPSASVTMDALRGSSAVAGAADVILLALKEGPVERSLRTAKSRDGEEGKPIAYRVWKTVTGGRKDDGTMETAPTVVMEERAPEADEPPPEVKEAEDEARIIKALTEMESSTSIDRVVRAARLKLTAGRDAFARLLGRREVLEIRKHRGSNYLINSARAVCPPIPPRPRDVGTSANGISSQDVQGRFGTPRDVDQFLD